MLSNMLFDIFMCVYPGMTILGRTMNYSQYPTRDMMEVRTAMLTLEGHTEGSVPIVIPSIFKQVFGNWTKHSSSERFPVRTE